MKASLSFITRTASVSETPVGIRTANFGPRAMEVLGYDRRDQKIMLVERGRGAAEGVLPQLFSIRAYGWLSGRMTPVHSFYFDSDEGIADYRASLEERLDELRSTLTPLFAVGEGSFRLNTRVTKRRAVRIVPETTPVRRYDMRVTVRPVSDDNKVIPMGARKSLTAYLRPRVRLEQVFAHPALEFAVAVVSYVGTPYDIGYERQTAIYVPLPDNRYRQP